MAIAPIQPLTWEPPYAVGAAPPPQKKTKKYSRCDSVLAEVATVGMMKVREVVEAVVMVRMSGGGSSSACNYGGDGVSGWRW